MEFKIRCLSRKATKIVTAEYAKKKEEGQDYRMNRIDIIYLHPVNPVILSKYSLAFPLRSSDTRSADTRSDASLRSALKYSNPTYALVG